jgi:hypothetical protein
MTERNPTTHTVIDKESACWRKLNKHPFLVAHDSRISEALTHLFFASHLNTILNYN